MQESPESLKFITWRKKTFDLWNVDCAQSVVSSQKSSNFHTKILNNLKFRKNFNKIFFHAKLDVMRHLLNCTLWYDLTGMFFIFCWKKSQAFFRQNCILTCKMTLFEMHFSPWLRFVQNSTENNFSYYFFSTFPESLGMVETNTPGESPSFKNIKNQLLNWLKAQTWCTGWDSYFLLLAINFQETTGWAHIWFQFFLRFSFCITFFLVIWWVCVCVCVCGFCFFIIAVWYCTLFLKYRWYDSKTNNLIRFHMLCCIGCGPGVLFVIMRDSELSLQYTRKHSANVLTPLVFTCVYVCVCVCVCVFAGCRAKRKWRRRGRGGVGYARWQCETEKKQAGWAIVEKAQAGCE